VAGELTALVVDPLLAPLWRAVHDRLCRGGATERSVVTVHGASADTRRAVDRLLGRVSSNGRVSVRLAELDAALCRAGTDKTAVVTAAVGPVIDRAEHRAAAVAAAGSAWAEIRSHPTAHEAPVAAWLDGVQAGGRLDRVGGAEKVLAALDVLAVLPVADEPVGRPVLAATVLGKEHALDDGKPVGRLVVAGLAARLGMPVPTTAADRAALWASAGVALDAVSTPALTLGLRPTAHGPLTEAAGCWADGGVPLPIPAAAIAAERWSVPEGTEVFVCENPSVVEAAAAKFGAAAPPLVCVSGMPGRAVSALLVSLADEDRARLRYHGDFGAGGIAIANLIIGRHCAAPWRMGTVDHRRAVERLAALGRQPNRLRGRVPPASWEPGLSEAITAYGWEVTEEHVLDELLADLGT